jgi:hypothetical protein
LISTSSDISEFIATAQEVVARWNDIMNSSARAIEASTYSRGLMNAAPRAIGSASSLYGFAQMSFGAVVTLIVAVCHDGSALPVAIVLVTAAAAGQLALLKA